MLANLRRWAARLLRLLDLLFAWPVVAVREVEAALSVNFSTS